MSPYRNRQNQHLGKEGHGQQEWVQKLSTSRWRCKRADGRRNGTSQITPSGLGASRRPAAMTQRANVILPPLLSVIFYSCTTVCFARIRLYCSRHSGSVLLQWQGWCRIKVHGGKKANFPTRMKEYNAQRSHGTRWEEEENSKPLSRGFPSVFLEYGNFVLRFFFWMDGWHCWLLCWGALLLRSGSVSAAPGSRESQQHRERKKNLPGKENLKITKVQFWIIYPVPFLSASERFVDETLSPLVREWKAYEEMLFFVVQFFFLLSFSSILRKAMKIMHGMWFIRGIHCNRKGEFVFKKVSYVVRIKVH